MSAIQNIVGFELGDLSEMLGASAGCSVQSDTVRTGQYAMRVANAVASGTAYAAVSAYSADGRVATFNNPASGLLAARLYFLYMVKPTTGLEEIARIESNGQLCGAVNLRSDGKLSLLNSGLSHQGWLTGPVLQPNTWYRIEIGYTPGYSSGLFELRLDGVPGCSQWSNAAAPNGVKLGKSRNWFGQSVEFYYDDVAVGYDWIGPGRVQYWPAADIDLARSWQNWCVYPGNVGINFDPSGAVSGVNDVGASGQKHVYIESVAVWDNEPANVDFVFQGAQSSKVNAVKLYSLTSETHRAGSSTPTALHLLDPNGNVFQTTNAYVGTSWLVRCAIWPQNPITFQLWSESGALSGFSAGVIHGQPAYDWAENKAIVDVLAVMVDSEYALCGTLPLLAYGNAVASGFRPLFTRGFDRTSGTVPLGLTGHLTTSGSIPLRMTGRAPASGELGISLGGHDVVAGDLSLYAVGPLTSIGALTFYMQVPDPAIGILPLAVFGHAPKPSPECPILDPTACIQITDELVGIYQGRIDAIINQLGKNVLLEYDPIKQPCPNCGYDAINDRSNGIYVIGGPAPFPRGQKCPYCRGLGSMQEPVLVCIKALIKWNPEDAMRYGIAVDDTQALVRTKTLLTDLPAIVRAKSAIMNYAVKDLLRLRVKLLRAPIPVGLRASRYCIAFWQLVDNG